MKLKELEAKIRQVRTYAADIQTAKEYGDAVEDRTEDISVMVGSVYVLVPAHSAMLMLRAEEKRLKEARAAVMLEIGLEDEDEQTD